MKDHLTIKDPQFEYRLFFGRLLFVTVIILLMTGVLIWRYGHLQIERYEDFATRADSNRVLARPVPPERGLIFDRNGILLADNRPSVNLSIVKERAENLDELLSELQQLVEISEYDLERFQRNLRNRARPYQAVPLRFNLSEQEQGVLAVNEYRLPGVQITAELLRYYPMGSYLAHVIGYVGSINDREIKRLDPVRYSGTHVVGKTGLEKFYEDQLLGEVGYEKVEVNARGRVMRKLERTPPKPGQDLHLYLDYRLQQTAMDALADQRGAVVAMDTATGGILAMASNPGFDPNLFVTGISHSNYRALLQDWKRPLFDRALLGQYPPGSTVKPIYALAALESGTISKGYKIYDPGFYQLKNDERKYRDWKKGGHGSNIYLRDAIIQSCDTVYYDIGFRMGIDVLSAYGSAFGLGAKTGIDMPSERAGIMPSREWKRGARGLAWYPGDTVNTSIGQGFTLTTPMQLAVATTRLATRGKIFKPRLAMRVGANDLTEISGQEKRIPIADGNWDYVIDAMKDVVHGPRGTAKIIAPGLSYEIAGKTGTAQVIGIKQDEEYDAEKVALLNRDHALFIAFAPVQAPKIAVAVLVENGEHGSSTAAPIARTVIDQYMENLSADSNAPAEEGRVNRGE